MGSDQRQRKRWAIDCVGLWTLFGVGLVIWLGPGMADIGRPPQLCVELFVAGLAFIPAVTRSFGRALEALQRWQMRWWLSVLLGIACTVYCGFTAWRQDRSFRTLWHDDSCYEIQARMMARGRLWMPALAVPDSFDSPYVFTTPVYAAIYFPGTALMLAPAVLAGLPIVTIPLLMSGAIATMLCQVVSNVIDSAAGVAAAVLWASSIFTRRFAISPMSHPPVILLTLVAIWTWLRWRSEPAHRTRWAVLGGAAVGWAAITRPLDAVCLLAPLIVIAMWELIRDVHSIPPRKKGVLVGVAIAAAAPFLLLMAVHNWGVTGHWSRFPHEEYVKSQDPGLQIGFRKFNPRAEPQSIVPQKRLMYDDFVKKQLVIHTPANIWPEFWLMRLPRFLSQILPASILIVFAMLGIAGVRSRPLLVIALPLLLLPAALAFYAWIPDYYALVIWPATSVLILLGARQFGGLVPPLRSVMVSAATVFVVALAVSSLPEFDPKFRDDVNEEHLQRINRTLDGMPDRSALVLFRFTPGASYFYEPVYNTGVAWPDDARILRAHDLGPVQNAKLFSYYASVQPDRMAYLYDRAADTLIRLGNVRALANRAASGT